MKLAEALVERKALKDRLDRLRRRLQANAKVQEGDQPSEAPEELLSEIEKNLTSLESLTVRINKTNIAEVLEEGTSIMEAIVRRDMLGLKRSILEELASSAAITRDRFSRSEIKFEPTVDVGEIRKQIDAVAKEYRELDTKLQAANWNVDLLN